MSCSSAREGASSGPGGPKPRDRRHNRPASRGTSTGGADRRAGQPPPAVRTRPPSRGASRCGRTSPSSSVEAARRRRPLHQTPSTGPPLPAPEICVLRERRLPPRLIRKMATLSASSVGERFQYAKTLWNTYYAFGSPNFVYLSPNFYYSNFDHTFFSTKDF